MRSVLLGKSGTLGTAMTWVDTRLSFRDYLSQSSEEHLRNLQGHDVLIHAGAVVGEKACQQNPIRARYVNSDSLVELVEIAAKAGVERSLFLSTSHVYGFGGPFRESDETNPPGLYASLKLAGEQTFLEACRNANHSGTVLRVFSVLGGVSYPFTLAGSLGRVISERKGEIRNPQDVRDFLGPTQISQIVRRLAAKRDPLPPIINVCSGEALTVQSVSERVLAHHRVDLSSVTFTQIGLPSTLTGQSHLLSKLLNANPPHFLYLDPIEITESGNQLDSF